MARRLLHAPAGRWAAALAAVLCATAVPLGAAAPAAPDGAASATHAPPPTLAPAQRRAVLDAVRPLAARRTAQAVRIRVDRLNVDRGWALLAGELVGPGGAALDWARAEGCHPELDKGLFAVLQLAGGRWQVRQLQVCAPEPPLWGTVADGTRLALPCGVYAGFTGPEGQDLRAACLAQSPP